MTDAEDCPSLAQIVCRHGLPAEAHGTPSENRWRHDAALKAKVVLCGHSLRRPKRDPSRRRGAPQIAPF